MERINIYDSDNPVFQIDSQIVMQAYSALDNFLIINETQATEPKVCAIYFSGHSIYYPNDETTFRKTIIENNRYEWYGQRVRGATKHIFLRDIHKQWYLSGINSTINSPESLLQFLRKETEGYKVMCIGSSAGGYAAILYGIQLDAMITYAFSPRIEMHSLSVRSNPLLAPLYYRLKDTERKHYMDLCPFIMKAKNPIYCFYPISSTLDQIQLNHINQNLPKSPRKLNLIFFKTGKHGVPFPKVALARFLTTDLYDWSLFNDKIFNPLIFSIKQVGLLKTIVGMINQLKKHYKSKHIGIKIK